MPNIRELFEEVDARDDAQDAALANAGGATLFFVTTGVTPLADTVTPTLFDSHMPAGRVTNFRLTSGNGSDPLIITVRNQMTDEALIFEIDSAYVMNTGSVSCLSNETITLQVENTAPGEAGPWTLNGIFEFVPA